MNKFSKTLRDNWIFLLMVLPGALWLVLFFYIPVFGNVVAFKDYHMTSNGSSVNSVLREWLRSSKLPCCSLTSCLGLSSVSLQMPS